MFTDTFSIKGVLIGFICYLIVSAVAMIVVVQLWMPVGVTDGAELARLAATDPTILLWQNVIGAVLSVLAGFLACHFSKAKGITNSLIIGGVLILYGVLGIYLHQGDPLPMQAAKLIAPVPLALLGGWLRLRLSSQAKPLGS